MAKKIKSQILNVVKILFACGIITWLLTSGKINLSVFKAILSPTYLSLCLLLTMVNIFLGSERWRLLLKNQQLDADSRTTLELTLIGIFFNFAMPGGVGGDVVKGFYLTKNHPEQKMRAALTVFMDRVLGLYAMMVMAVAAMAYDYQHVLSINQLKSIFILISILLAIATLGLGIVFSKKIMKWGGLDKIILRLPQGNRLLNLYHSMNSYGREPILLVNTILYSFVAQLMSILLLIVIGHAMGEGAIPWVTYLIVAPVGFMVTAIPISPAGVGVGQAAFYFLFNIYLGKTSEVGPTVITVFQILVFLFGLVGAFFYVRRKSPIIGPTSI